MKRIISALLIVAIISANSFAIAEENGGLWGQIGDFLAGVASGAGDMLDQAGDTLGKAGEAAGEAVNSAGQTIGDLWASAQDDAGNAWTWISQFASEQGSNASQAVTKVLSDLQSWVNMNGANALEQLEVIFTSMTEKVGIAADTAAEIWNSVLEYAKEKNIKPVVLIKLTLAILAKIYLGRLSKNASMMADAVILSSANTIIGWFGVNQIDSEKAAEHALGLIQDFLK